MRTGLQARPTVHFLASDGSEEIVSKPGIHIGVGVGIGIGFYERHSIQELIFFDPDTDPDADVHGASLATHKFD